MFKTKTTLSTTLERIDKFISDLKEGVTSHEKSIKILEEEVDNLNNEKKSLEKEINQANKLIGTLDGFNN